MPLGEHLPHGVPHLTSAGVDVPVWGPNDRGVCPQSQPAQDGSTRLGHGPPRACNGVVNIVAGSLNQDGVVHRGADSDAPLGGEAAGQPQHFRAIGLHRKVPQRAGIGGGADV